MENDFETVVNMALQEFYMNLPVEPVPNKMFGSTVEIMEAFPNVFPIRLWFFFDHMQEETWEKQCKKIASACGPTLHAIVLMGLAWAMFEGWTLYMQKRKHAPVDVKQYVLDCMNAKDMREVLEKEY